MYRAIQNVLDAFSYKVWSKVIWLFCTDFFNGIQSLSISLLKIRLLILNLTHEYGCHIWETYEISSCTCHTIFVTHAHTDRHFPELVKSCSGHPKTCPSIQNRESKICTKPISSICIEESNEITQQTTPQNWQNRTCASMTQTGKRHSFHFRRVMLMSAVMCHSQSVPSTLWNGTHTVWNSKPGERSECKNRSSPNRWCVGRGVGDLQIDPHVFREGRKFFTDVSRPEKKTVHLFEDDFGKKIVNML